MLRKFNVFQLFIGCIALSAFSFIYLSNSKAEEILNIDLEKELKKGNFVIGLKQHLGGEHDNFSNENKIAFRSEHGFLYLQSSNGVKHKSKKINIIWKDQPLKTPYKIKRFVFGPYASYESAKKQANNFKEKGLRATVAYPKNWEVWIPFENNLLRPSTENEYKVFETTFYTQITPYLSNEFTLRKLKGPIYIYSDKELRINGINFGKKFYLVKDSYGTWTLIQKIKFDDYLEGVLPYEIGLNSPLEALKSQAIIARTWGIYNSERFQMDNYHLCITTQCQVYKPPNFKSKRVEKAIKDTTNLIIMHRNKPINSFYHGSNGGISAKASESWEINDEPYLNTKIDGSIILKKSINHSIRNEKELNQFLDFEKKDFYGNHHSLFRWNKKISHLTISDNLIKHKLINKDDEVLDLKVLERGLSGRVKKLEIKVRNSERPIFILKDDIRRILNFLPSNLFIINKLNDNLWTFKGGGFGHGVGLSQSGAIEMAELGFTYQQILNHYYQGTKLKEIKILSQ